MACAPPGQGLRLRRPESDSEQRQLVVLRNKDGQCHGIHTSRCASDRLLRGHVARLPYCALPMRRPEFQILTVPVGCAGEYSFDSPREVVHLDLDGALQLSGGMRLNERVP